MKKRIVVLEFLVIAILMAGCKTTFMEIKDETTGDTIGFKIEKPLGGTSGYESIDFAKANAINKDPGLAERTTSVYQTRMETHNSNYSYGNSSTSGGGPNVPRIQMNDVVPGSPEDKLSKAYERAKACLPAEEQHQNVGKPEQFNFLPADIDSLRRKVIATAENWINTPYRYGGTNRTGVDCSNYVKNVLGEHGIRLSGTSNDQRKFGYAISRNQLLPGDLVFYNKHEAVYRGKDTNGRDWVLHAYGTKGKVCATPMDEVGKPIEFRRVIG